MNTSDNDSPGILSPNDPLSPQMPTYKLRGSHEQSLKNIEIVMEEMRQSMINLATDPEELARVKKLLV